jgi:hypothetical protein
LSGLHRNLGKRFQTARKERLLYLLSQEVSWQPKGGRDYIARIGVGGERDVELIIQVPGQRRSPLDGSLVLVMDGECVCRLEPGPGGSEHAGIPTPHLHYLDHRNGKCCEPFDPQRHGIQTLEDAARWFVNYCGIEGWFDWCDPP